MEEQNKKEISFLVFGGFIVLFVLFLFLSQEGSTKGAFTFEEVIGSSEIGGTSVITLVIIFVILVVVLIAVILLLKKFKKKKHTFIAPKTHEDSQKKGKLSFNPLKENIKSNLDKAPEDMADEDIESLFSETVGIKTEDESKVSGFSSTKNQEPMTNANQLKTQVNSLFDKGNNSKQVVEILKKKGFTPKQVSKVIDDINNDNLKNYINNALKQKFSKDQITRNLLSNGWKSEQISKFLK